MCCILYHSSWCTLMLVEAHSLSIIQLTYLRTSSTGSGICAVFNSSSAGATAVLQSMPCQMRR